VIDNLTLRVRNALVQLSVLSEVASSKLDPNKVHGGEADYAPQQSERSDLEFFVARLESVCRDAEAKVKACRKRQHAPPVETRDYWVVHTYIGVDYRTVAEKEGLNPESVKAIRRRHGRTEHMGHEALRRAA
jgi:hypothetical protein